MRKCQKRPIITLFCAQTLLPTAASSRLLSTLPIGKLRGLGGDKFGGHLADKFSVETIADLQKLELKELVRAFGESSKAGGGVWIYRIARGICLDAVKSREHTVCVCVGVCVRVCVGVCVCVRMCVCVCVPCTKAHGSK